MGYRSMWRIGLLIIGLLWLALPLRGETPLVKGGGASPTQEETRRVVLPNGVRLIVKPEPESEEVAILVFVRQETPTTLADVAIRAMVAKALFYGSVNNTYESTARSVAKIGGNLTVRFYPDYTLLACVTGEAQLHEATALLCEALKNAEFTPDALERARQLILREHQQRQEDTFYSTYDALCQAVRGDTELDAVALRHVTQEQARAYYKRTYVPANTVIVVVGKCDAAKVSQAFTAGLFDYDRAAPAKVVPRASQPWPETMALTFPTPGSTAYALLALPSPPVTSPDYPAFVVLSTLIGNGHASRLFHHIRDETGLGYNVGTLYEAEYANPLVAYLQWDTRRAAPRPPGSNSGGENSIKTPTAEEGLKQIQAQIESLLKKPPTEAEVVRARNFAIGRYALRHERARERAFLLGWYETMGIGFNFDTTLPDRLAAVTRDDLLRLSQTYLSRHATAVVTPVSPH